MRKKGIGILLIFAIGLSGCKTQPQVTDNATVETDGVELIKDAGNLSQDSAQGAVETLYDVGAERVKTAELVSEKQGVILKATDIEGDSVLSWIRWFGLSGNDTKGFAGR